MLFLFYHDHCKEITKFEREKMLMLVSKNKGNIKYVYKIEKVFDKNYKIGNFNSTFIM